MKERRPVVVATTAKDSKVNIINFIDRNVRLGVDFFIIFYDSEEGGLEINRENVVVINSDSQFWGGDKHENLNFRQRAHINLASSWLKVLSVDCWLINLDVDEVVDIDFNELSSQEVCEARSISFKPMEAVSHSSQRKEELEYIPFKRLLSDNELSLLYMLKEIPLPDNKEYFNGYTEGKPGIVPSLHTHVKGHYVEHKAKTKTLVLEKSHVLHFDMPTLSDFIKKWERNIEKGVKAGHKINRSHVRNSFIALRDNLSSSSSRQSFQEDIYRRNIEDDKSLLSRLGLLEEVTLSDRGESKELMIKDELREISFLVTASSPGVFINPEYEKRVNFIRDKAFSIKKENPSLAEKMLRALSLYRPNGEMIKAELEKLREIKSIKVENE